MIQSLSFNRDGMKFTFLGSEGGVHGLEIPLNSGPENLLLLKQGIKTGVIAGGGGGEGGAARWCAGGGGRQRPGTQNKGASEGVSGGCCYRARVGHEHSNNHLPSILPQPTYPHFFEPPVTNPLINIFLIPRKSNLTPCLSPSFVTAASPP